MEGATDFLDAVGSTLDEEAPGKNVPSIFIDHVAPQESTGEYLNDYEESQIDPVPTQEELFPGYVSDSETTGKTGIGVVAKHIKDGGILSTFKTKEEIIVRRERVRKRKEVEGINLRLRETEADAEEALHKLETARAMAMASQAECEKIMNELKRVLWKENPRWMRSSQDTEHFEIPPDDKIGSGGLRALKQAYLHHLAALRHSESVIPSLEQELAELERQASNLQIRQTQMIPVALELQQADAEEREEQQMIAAYRAQIEVKSALAEIDNIQYAEWMKKSTLDRHEKRVREQEEALCGFHELTRTRVRQARRKRKKDAAKFQSASMRALARREAGLKTLKESVSTVTRRRTASAVDIAMQRDPVHHRQKSIQLAKLKMLRFQAKQGAEKLAILRRLADEKEQVRKHWNSVIPAVTHQSRDRHTALPPFDSKSSHSPKPDPPAESCQSLSVKPDNKRVEPSASVRFHRMDQTKINQEKLPVVATIEDLLSESQATLPIVSSGIRASLESLVETVTRTPRNYLPPPRHVIKRVRPVEPLALKGLPFSPSPKTLVFADYVPGEAYTKHVVLTNTSSRVNSFKLEELPMDLQEYFELSNLMAGRMSAGLTWTITVTFTAPDDADEILDRHITFEAEYGGKFQIEVKTRKRRCCPVAESYYGQNEPPRKLELSNPETVEGYSTHFRLNFGQCSVGERVTKFIRLANRGVIETGFRVTQVPAQESFPAVEGPFVVCPGNRHLGSYAHQVIQISFRPTLQLLSAGAKKGIVSPDRRSQMCNATIKVTPDDESVAPLFFDVDGEAVDCPVYVDKTNIDFGTCAVGCLYSDCLTLRNRGSIALKFVFTLDPEAARHGAQHDQGGGSLEGTDEQGPENPPTATVCRTSDFGEVEISPHFGFVQPGEPCSVWVRLKPSLNGYGNLELVRSGEGPPRFQIPFRISILQGQHPPLRVDFTGSVTRSDITFTPKHLEFGLCSVYETAVIPVSITNNSHVAQKVAFSAGSDLTNKSATNQFTMKPGHDRLVMLPLETLKSEVVFTPSHAKEYRGKIVCRSSLNHQSEIICTGTGVRSLIKVSTNHLIFPPTARGSTSVARVVFSYDEEAAFCSAGALGGSALGRVSFLFSQPELLSACAYARSPTGETTPCLIGSGDFSGSVKITPWYGELGRHESVSVEFAFQAPLAISPDIANPPTADVQPLDETAGAADENRAKHGEDRARSVTPSGAKTRQPSPAMRQRSSVMSTRPAKFSLAPASASRTASGRSGSRSAKKGAARLDPNSLDVSPMQVFGIACEVRDSAAGALGPAIATVNLQLTAVVTRADIELVGEKAANLDFEYVPVGERSVRQIIIRNVSSQPVVLRAQSPDPLGPFGIVNAMREVKAGALFVVRISFCPERQGSIHDSLEISSLTTQIPLQLVGHGVLPSVIIEPRERLVNFKDVLLNDTAVKSFRIHNPCTFPVFIQLVPSDVVPKKDSHGVVNFSMSDAFACTPLEAAIAPNAKQEITVRFQPDRVTDNYRETVAVNVRGARSNLSVELLGRCWSNTLFLAGYQSSSTTADLNPWSLPPALEAELAARASATASGGNAFDAEAAPERPAVVETKDSSAAALPASVHTTVRNVTVRSRWRRGPDGLYRPEMAEPLAIVNAKLTGRAELKRVLVGEFLIEPIRTASDGVEPGGLSAAGRQPIYVFQLEPMSGTVEVGSKRVLKVHLQGVGLANLLLGGHVTIPVVVAESQAPPAAAPAGSAVEPLQGSQQLAAPGGAQGQDPGPAAAGAQTPLATAAPAGSAAGRKSSRQSGSHTASKRSANPTNKGNVFPVRVRSAFRITLKNGINVYDQKGGGVDEVTVWNVTLVADPGSA